jgi:general secretion pathway protein G
MSPVPSNQEELHMRSRIVASQKGMTLPGSGGDQPPYKNLKRIRSERGMTLLEIMVVVLIIGLIAGAVAVNVMGKFEEAKIQQAKTGVKVVEDCVNHYKLSKGSFPSTEEGIGAIKAQCKNVKDPWDREYVYLYPGQANPDSFDIISYGADGQPGGEGKNADIVNK